MDVCVVIPTRNEEATIGNVIDSVRGLGYRVVVVDSLHSMDGTRKIAAERGAEVIVDNGRGKGDALRAAIQRVDADVLVFFDADGSHLPGDIPSVVKPIIDGEAEMVIASRMLGGSLEFNGTATEAARIIACLAITLIINYRWGVRLTDTQNGFRAVKADVARRLRLESDRFDVESELTMKCVKMGYMVREVPSRELGRVKGSSGIKIATEGPVILWRVLRNLV